MNIMVTDLRPLQFNLAVIEGELHELYNVKVHSLCQLDNTPTSLHVANLIMSKIKSHY